MTVLETVELKKNFGDISALKGVNLAVRRGEIHGFIGPNGAGKTTTMRILLGLLKPMARYSNGFRQRCLERCGGDPPAGGLCARGSAAAGPTSQAVRSWIFWRALGGQETSASVGSSWSGSTSIPAANAAPIPRETGRRLPSLPPCPAGRNC